MKPTVFPKFLSYGFFQNAGTVELWLLNGKDIHIFTFFQILKIVLIGNEKNPKTESFVLWFYSVKCNNQGFSIEFGAN